ncbi:hypothetical protein [Kitasatospora sp. NPDC002040]|uniref:hypothetical protein n=1 Tax=Kitasatospora sp. NPDC002040 TaxID=3154661 RepID=UPI003327781A
MTDTDLLVPVLTGIVADLFHFLDTCSDEEVDPDTAVKLGEQVSWVLQGLPAAPLADFLSAIAALAEAEPDLERRHYLEELPYACGLLEDE